MTTKKTNKISAHGLWRQSWIVTLWSGHSMQLGSLSLILLIGFYIGCQKSAHNFFSPPRTFLVLINPEVVQSTHHKQPAKQDEFSGASSQNANICYA